MRLAHNTAVKTGVAWCALGRLAGAQAPGVAVDPHIVVLTPARPGGEVTVFNPHSHAASFTVDLRFGYATTDPNGRPRVELRDGTDSASAAGWITPYPRTFTLRGGTSRTVRLLANPPAGTADGEYWARLTVHARDVEQTPSVVSEDSATTRVRIALETATVLPVFFRQGRVITGVAIDSMSGTADPDGRAIEVRAMLRRTGNAAFLGVAHIAVSDSSGREITSLDRPLAVYRSYAPHWRLSLPEKATASSYSVAITFSTRRQDVPSSVILQSPPVAHRITIAREVLP